METCRARARPGRCHGRGDWTPRYHRPIVVRSTLSVTANFPGCNRAFSRTAASGVSGRAAIARPSFQSLYSGGYSPVFAAYDRCRPQVPRRRTVTDHPIRHGRVPHCPLDRQTSRARMSWSGGVSPRGRLRNRRTAALVIRAGRVVDWVRAYGGRPPTGHRRW
jgi:hypothetical protein